MATNQEEEEKKIPVLTVTKNNAILKNIFLVVFNSDSSEVMVVVGRNPSCDIVLSHPSISRFHLRLLSLSSDSLSLRDLSSVHGTRVNGVKIEPNVRVELNEGDIIQIGGSSRVYKLHWVPLSRAYDVDSSFVSPSYKLAEDKDHEERLEDGSGIVYENSSAQHVDEDNSEGSDYEVSDEKSRLLLSSEIPLEPFSSEKGVENTWIPHKELDGDIISNSYSDLLAMESETSSWLDEIQSETEVDKFSPDNKNSVKLVGTESEQNLDFVESLASLRSYEYSETPCLDTFHLFSEFDIQQMDRENESQQENIGTPLENKNISMIDHEKRTSPSIFSEKLEFEAEISSLPYEIPLESENIFSQFDVQQMDKKNASQEVNIAAATLENKKTSIIGHGKRSSLSNFFEKLATEKSSDIPLETESLFSDHDIQQVDNNNESQQENIVTPAEYKRTSVINHEKKTSPNIFSEKLESEAEISTLPYGIPLESENIFSVFDVQQLDKENESQEVSIATPLENENTSIKDHEKRESFLEQNADLQESLVALFSHEPFERSSSQNCKISTEVNTQEVNQENESQKEYMVTPPLNNSEKKSSSSKIWSRRCKPSSDLRIQICRSGEKRKLTDNIENIEVTKSPLTAVDSGEELYTPDKENFTPKTLEKLRPYSSSSSYSSSSLKIKEKISDNLFEIWSRRCKPSSDLRIQICRSGEKRKLTDNIENIEVTKSPLTAVDSGEELYTPDKENFTPKTLEKLRPYSSSSSYSSSSLKIKEKISDNLFDDWYEYNKQFTSDKENNTPKTPLMRSMLEMSKMKGTSGSNLCISSSLENMLAPLIEKNSAQKLLQPQKLTKSCSRSHKISKLKSGIKSSAKRVPFQSLFESSSFSSAEKDCNIKKYNAALEVKEKVKEYKRRWHMVVDATCLLNKESRKTLELLRGLKGTQLTIPRFVVRELESLNRQSSLFRSKPEAFYALEWIEECTANTDWWIHIQSSDVKPMSIAQTPPTTTRSRFSEMHRRFYDGVASSVLSSWESLFEIVSPTAEDHVLECALEIRRNTRDVQLVLLSNDVTLMIKAMAEGLRCETAEEFRGSLVNPFSDRFLWSESSPRGLTWSCADDLILKELFYGHHTKMGGGEAFQGLKILLAIAT